MLHREVRTRLRRIHWHVYLTQSAELRITKSKALASPRLTQHLQSTASLVHAHAHPEHKFCTGFFRCRTRLNAEASLGNKLNRTSRGRKVLWWKWTEIGDETNRTTGVTDGRFGSAGFSGKEKTATNRTGRENEEERLGFAGLREGPNSWTKLGLLTHLREGEIREEEDGDASESLSMRRRRSEEEGDLLLRSGGWRRSAEGEKREAAGRLLDRTIRWAASRSDGPAGTDGPRLRRWAAGTESAQL